MAGRPLMNDLTGNVYGRLTVVCRAENRKDKVYWHCRCTCGKECDVQTHSLILGYTRSCGCYRRERQMQIWKLKKRIRL